LHNLLDCPPRGEFDLDIYRVLVRRLSRLAVIPLELGNL